MFNIENYKYNIDVEDKYDIKNINVDKSVNYRGSINIVSKKKDEEKFNCFQPLAAATVGLNNTAAPLPNNLDYYTTWTDIDSQEKIMNTKPTCYIILGKPGSGAYSLGEALSKKLKCVHICPKNVLVDEIEQKSPTGLCLDFNMRHNNPIKFYNILPIMLKKLKSTTVKHRGYIVSGLPLVTSDRSSQYLFTTMYGEESILVVMELLNNVIFNLKKKPRKIKQINSTSQSSVSSDRQILEEEESQQEELEPEENALEEEIPLVEIPKFILDSCSDVVFHQKPYFDTKKATLIKQFNEIIMLDMPADIIIYLSCPDVDLITKNKHKFLNYANSSNTVDTFITNMETELRWPVKCNINDYTRPYEVHTYNPKYNCRQPINFKGESMEQMCNYRLNVFPYVEKKLEDFDPKLVIKLDARISVYEMIYQLMERFIFLKIKPVLIPEPLLLEEPIEDTEEFWKSVEELNKIQSGIIQFRRYTSPWFNRCPVELKHRQSVCGNPKYAVTFLKHIYLLSSLSNMISFCRNPRPYLKLKYLEPTCRIIIVGTKSSGKTFISECLSLIFDTPIIDYNIFLKSQKLKKYEVVAKTILSEIIATIEDARFEIWQSIEMDRYSQLEMWCSSALFMLKDYIPLLIEYNKYQKKNVLKEHKIESQPEPEILQDLEGYVIDIDILNSLFYYREQLSFLPFLNDVEKCEQALMNKKYIIQFAPDNLKTMRDKPGVPALGDDDVNKAISDYIVANDLNKELEPTIEEIMNEMVKVLCDLDMNCKVKSNSEYFYCKYIIDGFPSDPEYWGYLSEFKLLPDYTIALIENRELDSELIHYYLNVEKITKDYRQRFLLSPDPLVQIKLTTTNYSELQKMDREIVVNDIINTILNQMQGNDEVYETDEAQFSTTIAESIEKFREDWDSVKLILEENHKCFIEVELENKTDVQILDDVLLGIRKCYTAPCELYEDIRADAEDEEDGDEAEDLLVHNNHQFLGETNIYCPVSYYDHGILWEGKSDFCIKYNNKIHYFSKEECLNSFQRDPTKYQSYIQPYKRLPSLRICVIGPIGTGKTTVSKYIAKELGLLHINLTDFINAYLMPKHFRKVGRQYENSFTDPPLDEEAVIEFQMDEDNENLISNILSNENELRRMVYNYLERGTPMLAILMQKIIKKIWFEEPFVSTGIVLDGYPRVSDDVENMITCFCIPDLVIQLESSIDSSLERMSPLMFRTWKIQLNEAKNKAKIKLDNEKKEWMEFITKNIVIKLISDEIFDNIFFSLGESLHSPSTESLIIDADPSGSSNVDVNLFNAYNLMIEEFPEPEDKNEWEKPEEVRERIDARIESIFESEEENITMLKELLLENTIKVGTIDATKPFNKVIRLALLKLSTIRNRNQSFFEETYIIDSDIAEVLLTEGFYFFSKFNRMCPVFICDNPNTTFNPYKLYKRKGKVFPVIHRSYIYFVVGEENLKKFRLDPLKYVDSTAIMSYFEYPLRISIIGAPKSGKSELAQKLARKYGLLCLSRGTALRKILESMSWTELSSDITKNLREGITIDTYLVMKAIQIAAMDHRAVTYGYVFDGFPETSLEALELNREGLYPNIVFDISSTKDYILDRSQKEIYYDIIKRKPPYCKSFIEYRYTKWTEKSENIRNWINEDYQNMYVLDGDKSRWQCLQNADNIIKNILHKVNYYLKNEKLTIVPADGMCISNEIFEKRMSEYKNVCPLCLNSNTLRHSEYPIDRKGIVQFRNKFYWICEEHISKVLKNPRYIMTTREVHIPEIPAIVKAINSTLVYENGVCIVTYAENLPGQKIETGSNKFAANFQGKTYLFCGRRCLQKFMEKPHMYCDIMVFKERKLFPSLSVTKLPNLGYLEQTIGKILTDACCSVNAIRPKYPGIDIKLSGLIFIALYLKTHNPQTDKLSLVMYEKALKTYEARCKLILDVGLRLRSMDNPFAKYPVCCRGFGKYRYEKENKSQSSIQSSTGVSVITTEFNKSII